MKAIPMGSLIHSPIASIVKNGVGGIFHREGVLALALRVVEALQVDEGPGEVGGFLRAASVVTVAAR